MSKSRQEFLQWHFSEVDRIAEQISDEAAANFNESVEERWPAWQASRAALVIELPPVLPEPVSSGDPMKADGEAASWNIWVGDKLAKTECLKAIEASGVRVQS